MDDLFLLTAFVGGLVSFFSPCILPLVPVYLVYVGGVPGAARTSVMANAVLFVLGFSAVFTLLAAGAGVLGWLLSPYAGAIRLVSVVVLVLFGLMLLDVIKWTPPWAHAPLKPPARLKNQLAMSFVVGIIFALAWTPCVGIVLGSILTMALNFEDWQSSTLLLGAYSAGLGIPFLVSAFFFDRVSRLRKLTPYTARLKKVAGVALIAFAILIQLDLLRVIVGFLTNTRIFP